MKRLSIVWPAAPLTGALALGPGGRVNTVAPERAAASRLTPDRVVVLGPQNGDDVAGTVAMTRYGSKSCCASIARHGLSEYQQDKVASFPDEVALDAPGGITPRRE